jgi:hypothetical protein
MTTVFSDADGDLSLVERQDYHAQSMTSPLSEGGVARKSSEWPGVSQSSDISEIGTSPAGNRLPDGDAANFGVMPLIGGDIYSGAAPLMPLRTRDLAVLEDLFQQEKIDEVEAEILRILFFLHPEPCWEDDPLDFLKEYL